MTAYSLSMLGDDAVAIRPEDRTMRHPIARALRATGDWIDVVPGKEIVAAQFDPLTVRPADAIARMEACLAGFKYGNAEPVTPVELHLDFSADKAPDLDGIAQQNGLSREVLLDRIFHSDLVVDMLGFTPGFAYVEGVDRSLRAERLSVPRQRVAAGSVGLVSGQLGLYGLQGPGGWPIIGRLRERLFDSDRQPPFLLHAGQPIKLKPTGL